MKKIYLPLFMMLAMFTTANIQAQTTSVNPPVKVGIFDIDRMVQALPGYAKVDSALQVYVQDSLRQEYLFYQQEYQRLDSTFKDDSAKAKPKSVLDEVAKQRRDVAINLVYWQQIQRNKTQSKRAMLAQPLYEEVSNAYSKVLAASKVTIVFKPDAIEMGTNEKVVVDLLSLVAKELKIPIGPGNNNAQPPAETKRQGASPTGKPKK